MCVRLLCAQIHNLRSECQTLKRGALFDADVGSGPLPYCLSLSVSAVERHPSV